MLPPALSSVNFQSSPARVLAPSALCRSANFQSSPVRTVPALSGACRPANFQSSPARTVLVPLVPPSMSAERIASLPLASAEPPARVASVGRTVRPAAPDRSPTSEGPPPVRSLAAMRVVAIAPPNENDLLIRWSTPSEERRPASPVRSAEVSSALRSKPRSAPAGSEFSWRRNAASLIARWTTFASASFDMSLLLRFGVAGGLTASSRRFVHPYDASSVMLMTFLDVVSSPSARSLEFGQIDRVAARPADAAVQCILDHERPQHLVLVAAEDVEYERLRLRVLAAGAAAAKAARSERCTLADPTVHFLTLPASPSPARHPHNAPSGPEIRLLFRRRSAPAAGSPLGPVRPAPGRSARSPWRSEGVRTAGPGRRTRLPDPAASPPHPRSVPQRCRPARCSSGRPRLPQR